MIGFLVGLLLLFWIFGRTRGVLSGLAGGFLGALVLIGMANTAGNGDLTALYSPGQLLAAAASMAAVAAVLALVIPYATGFACVGWAAGAVLAAVVAPSTGQAIYILPLAAHVLAAAAVVCLARRRAVTSSRGPRLRGPTT